MLEWNWLYLIMLEWNLAKLGLIWLCYMKLIMLQWVWVKFAYVELNWTEIWIILIMLLKYESNLIVLH
jgi:hypothetical protein